MDASRLDSICELQRAILTRAVELVKMGGDVVYSTCSLSPRQNEGVVEAVLAQINKNADCPFRLELAPVFGSADEEALLRPFGLRDSCLPGAKRIAPGPESASAMFMAKLRKRPQKCEQTT